MILLGTSIKKFLILIGLPIFWLFKFLFIFSAKLVAYILLQSKYLLAGCLFLGLSGILIWFYFEVLDDLPNVNEIYNPPKLSTKILDRNGVLLYKFYEDENRSWIPLKNIPQSLVWATLAIEDKDFYKHHGISIRGMVQASVYNILKRNKDQKLRGGSTITQQLVKNVFFQGDKTYQRKIKEAILSILVETKLTKDEILERYFNQVAYGGETYGVQEAAWKYFKKNVWEINMAEATFLAGLPAAPSSYSPFGNNPEYGHLRQKHVVDEMVNAGFINKTKAEEILKEKISITKEEKNILAPHFVFFVKDYLEKRFGYQNFGRRGLEITTSLDIKIQNLANSIVEEEINKVKKLNISNGGAIVVNPKNGEILAMVGSRDYYSKEIDGKYNITTALRQPGSSIKPINYLLALKKGWTLASPIDDSPVIYQVSGQKPYAPRNYNGKFMGRVNLRTALASSLNVPSVKILASDGVADMIDLAELMGITTWKERNRFGLALALGSGEVKMIDMASAYSIFADSGMKKDIKPVLKIKNYLGEVIYEGETNKIQVIDPKLTFLINNVLSDNQARSPIFGLNSKLNITGKTVAVKTGTTNSLKDNWCIGWTPSILVAAWVGNNDGKSMSWVASGVSGATPIWNKIISLLLAGKENEKWDVPMGVYKASVCGKEEYFINGTEKNIKCAVLPKNENK